MRLPSFIKLPKTEDLNLLQDTLILSRTSYIREYLNQKIQIKNILKETETKIRLVHQDFS